MALIPDDVPTDFVPKRLRSIVGSGSSLNRRAWECALLLKLREELRSGNTSVEHSLNRRYTGKRWCAVFVLPANPTT